MLKTLTDSIISSIAATVKTRVTKVVKIDTGDAEGVTVNADVDVRAMRESGPVSVTTLDETPPVALEPGRYVVISIFMRLP